MSTPQTLGRKNISKRVRYEVLRRDNFTCRYCRTTDGELTIDHVTPVALGGTNDPANLVAACRDCNAGKTSTSPGGDTVAQVAEDAIRWSAAMRRAANTMLDDLDADNRYAGALDAAWSRWRAGEEQVPRPTGWWNSATAWRSAGLPEALMVDAVQRAMGNTRLQPDDVWRYFCGIVWNRISELQSLAQESLPAVPEGAALERAVSMARKAFPWDVPEANLDEDSLQTARIVLHPSRAISHLQFRALSRIVDGAEWWNRNAALAELGIAE